MLPGIVARLKDPPPANQKMPDGTWDAIRVGRKGLVLARDWLDRELSRERKIVLARSAVIIQACYRASENHREYQKNQSAWSIQSCLRATNACKPYKALRSTTLQIMPEMHAFTGRVIASRAADTAAMTTARNEMNAFLDDNKRLEKNEAEERKLACLEDEYSWKLSDATFAQRITEDKAQYLAMAEAAYGSASGIMSTVKDFIESNNKKGADADSRWQKMQTEGQVRSVPLVRQYKSEAEPFVAPGKDAYRFKYSFSYKGAKAVDDEGGSK